MLANCFTVHFNKSVVCIIKKPHTLVTDQLNRLHCETGPAVQFNDGYAVYAWRGLVVPEKWIVSPNKVTAREALRQTNVELRAAACEIVGWDRILASLKCIVLDKHSDPGIGELVESTVNMGDLPSRFLRVRCGTGRDFVLPVPQTVKTALQANARTYGFDNAEDYQPEVRT